ncbi:MAG: rod shape-determining protein MreC [Ilumatobacteraceae bacterium]
MSRKRVFVLLILTSLLLISLDRRNNAVIDKVRTGFQTALKPFDTAADAIARPIARAWDGITDYDRLEKENQALQDQLDAAKGAEITARASVLQYQAVLDLYELSKDYPHVMARVTGDAPSNFQNTVQITVGTGRGVKVGMPVLSSAGLVGKVTKVYVDSAEVSLITDPNYSIGAEVLAVAPPPSTTTTTIDPDAPAPTTTTTLPDLTPLVVTTTASTSTTLPGSTTSTTVLGAVRETGTLQGQGSGKLPLLRFVDDSSVSTIKVGDAVQTAGGVDGLAPEGLPIGTISNITESTGSRNKIVEVEPNADLDELYFVSVVLYTPSVSGGG